MRRPSTTLLLIACFAFLFACGDEGGGPGEETVEFPLTVTLGAEEALVATTGEIIDHADFIGGDLVTFKNQTIKVQSGCETSLAHCRPLHVCQQSSQSTPYKFTDLSQVCKNPPADDDPSSIINAKAGMGFTVQLNTCEGYARVFVEEVQGSGDAATITLTYELLEMAE